MEWTARSSMAGAQGHAANGTSSPELAGVLSCPSSVRDARGWPSPRAVLRGEWAIVAPGGAGLLGMGARAGAAPYLGGDPDGAGVLVALAHHDAAERYEGRGAEPKLLAASSAATRMSRPVFICPSAWNHKGEVQVW